MVELDVLRSRNTPVYTRVWPDSDALNQRLRDVVINKKATTPGLAKSNCGGWQSERDFQLWPDPAVAEVLDRMRSMLRDVVAATVPGATEDLLTGWDIEAWANVNEESDSVAPHNHASPTNMWAAIYYVKTGEPGSAAVNSGFTRFVNSNGIPRPADEVAEVLTADADVTERQDRCAEGELPYHNTDLQVSPEAGKMVVFPATLWHYVTPYEGDDERITLAFNLRHTGFIRPDPMNLRAETSWMWRNFRGVMVNLEKGKSKVRQLTGSAHS